MCWDWSSHCSFWFELRGTGRTQSAYELPSYYFFLSLSLRGQGAFQIDVFIPPDQNPHKQICTFTLNFYLICGLPDFLFSNLSPLLFNLNYQTVIVTHSFPQALHLWMNIKFSFASHMLPSNLSSHLTFYELYLRIAFNTIRILYLICLLLHFIQD